MHSLKMMHIPLVLHTSHWDPRMLLCTVEFVFSLAVDGPTPDFYRSLPDVIVWLAGL